MVSGESLQTSLYDLEVIVRDTPGEGFVAELRLPDSSAPQSTRLPRLPPVLLDRDLRKTLPPYEYGRLLYDWLFPLELWDALQFAETIASDSTSLMTEGASPGVRIRLSLDRRSPDLARLPWEALWGPDHDWPLSLRTAFSRYIPVRLPKTSPIVKAPLRMLLVASDPPGLGKMDLTAIDQELVQKTTKRALSGLTQWIDLKRLSEPPTLKNISAFTSQPHEVLHLLAHAIFKGDQGQLVVAGPDGSAMAVDWPVVVKALISASAPPRLVFVSTPAFADDDPDTVLTAFGQQLVEAGVQAVVAVQGPMGGDALRTFTERFYDVLLRTGVVDVAMVEARRSIFRTDGAEWTYPVLFSRTNDNRLFQPLSQASEQQVREFASAWVS